MSSALSILFSVLLVSLNSRFIWTE